MKHVFIIHSNITYLAALGVICKEKIDLKDVVIISWCKFKRDTPIKTYNLIPYSFKQSLLHPIDYLFTVRYLDRQITKLVNNEPYIAYTETLYHLHDIVVTHPLCQKFHFIEEGLSVYENEPEWFKQTCNYSCQPSYRYRGLSGIKRKLSDIMMIIKGYKLEMLGLPALYNAYFNAKGIKFYGFSDFSFYGVQNPHRISLKEVKESFSWNLYYNKLENVDIWIGQNNPPGSKEVIDKYVKAIEEGCAKKLISQGKNKIMVKFHSIEEMYAKSQTLKMFEKNGINVEIIPDNVVLEIELFNAKNVTLYSISSSLLVYASMLGIKCNCIWRYFYNSEMPISSYSKIINIL